MASHDHIQDTAPAQPRDAESCNSLHVVTVNGSSDQSHSDATDCFNSTSDEEDASQVDDPSQVNEDVGSSPRTTKQDPGSSRVSSPTHDVPTSRQYEERTAQLGQGENQCFQQNDESSNDGNYEPEDQAFSFQAAVRPTMNLNRNRSIQESVDGSNGSPKFEPAGAARQLLLAPTAVPQDLQTLSSDSNQLSSDDARPDPTEDLEAPEVQRQVDQQLYSEASADGSDEGDSASEQSSDDVIMVDDVPSKPDHHSSQFAAPGYPVQRSPVVRYREPQRLAPTAQRALLQQPTARVPAPAATTVKPPLDDTEDLLRVIGYKYRQKDEAWTKAFEAEIQALQGQLQESESCREELQDQAAEYQQRCQELTVTVEKYRDQVTKVKTLQKFMNGLGNDLGGLKHTLNTQQEKLGDLGHDVRERLLLDQQLQEQLAQSKTTLQKAVEIKDLEINFVVAHRDSLKEQLNDMSGQLAEALNRSSDFQGRIKNLEHGDRKGIAEAIADCKESMLHKLSNAAKKEDQLALGLGELQLAVKQLSEHPSASASDCEAITTAVQKLESSLLSQAENGKKSTDPTSEIVASLDTLRRNLAQDFQGDLKEWKSSIDEHISRREDHAQLRAELEGTSSRIAELQSQIGSAKEAEQGLNSTITALRERIAELEAASLATAERPSNNVAQAKDQEKRISDAVSEAKRQMTGSTTVFNAQQKAQFDNRLKRATSEFDACKQKLRTQEETSTTLRARLEQLEATQASTLLDAQGREQAAVDRAQSFEAKLQSAQNVAVGLKELQVKYDAMVALRATEGTAASELRGNNDSLTREVHESQAALLQARNAAEQANEHLKGVREQQAAQLKELGAKLTGAEEQIKKKTDGLSQLKVNCELAINKHKQNHKAQVDALQDELDRAQRELSSQGKDAETSRRATEEACKRDLTAWQTKLGEAERNAAESDAAKDEAISAAQVQQQRGDSLQAKLREAEHKIAESTTATEEATRTAGYQQQRGDALQAKLGETERNIADSAAAKDAAILAAQGQQQRADALQEKLTELQVAEETRLHKERVAALRKVPEPAYDSSAQTATMPHPESTASSHQMDAGPTGTIPTKTRKKADRNTNTIVDAGPSVVPAKRRRVSESQDRQTAQATMVPRDPVEKDSRPEGRAQQNVSRMQPNNRHAMPQLAPRSSDSEEMLDYTTTMSQQAQLPDTVPETQLDETLATFASFTKTLSSSQGLQSKSSQGLQSKFASSQDQAGSHFFGQKSADAFAVPRHRATKQPSARTTMAHPAGSPDFQIFEDQDDDQPVQDDDEFTFKMPTAKPNSASKRMPRTQSDQSNRPQSRGNQAYANRFRTPDNYDALHTISSPKPMPEKRGPGSSSTPPFIEKPQTQVYGSGSSVKARRRLSANSNYEAPTVDPRITAKSAGQKRVVAERESQMSYEPEPKRRAAPSATALNMRRVSSNDGMLARSNQSVNDLPRISDTIPRRAPGGGEGGSRMRTYAGGSTRALRSKTKKTRNDEYSARFSQELGGQ